MRNYIIITKIQADQIRGNYNQRPDGSFKARVEPVELPDGTFMIPEAVLNSELLKEIKPTVEAMVEPGNANVQDIPDLPDAGVPVTKDRIYLYKPATEETPESLVICRQSHTRTEHAIEDIPALFTFHRDNTDDLEWIPNELVKNGWKRWYNGKQYECLTPVEMLTVVGQTPDITPAVWKAISVGIPVWVQPTGAHDAYQIGDKVHFPKITDPVYESLIDANVWSPTVYPAGWKKL